MTAMRLEPSTEFKPVRECSGCPRIWPADWEYCQNCVIWLPGHETVERIVRLVPNSVDAPSFAPWVSGSGKVYMAFELRCSSEHPATGDLVVAQNIAENVLAQVASRTGVSLLLPGRCIAAQWADLEAGCYAAARVVDAVAAPAPPSMERARRIGNRPSLQIGLVALGNEAPRPQDAIALAFRLACLAQPNTALFSRSAYELCVERFDFQGVQPVVAKSEPLSPVFRFLGKAERSGTNHVGPRQHRDGWQTGFA